MVSKNDRNPTRAASDQPQLIVVESAIKCEFFAVGATFEFIGLL
jgi:hypothetical protein